MHGPLGVASMSTVEVVLYPRPPFCGGEGLRHRTAWIVLKPVIPSGPWWHGDCWYVITGMLVSLQQE